MADNKNQHFVPKCHLKPFSADGDGRAINLLNLDRDLAIRGAPVKTQCSRDYFYGHDAQLERAIQAVEGAYAASLGRLVTADAPPTELDCVALRRFVLLQHVRTEAASQRAAYVAAALAAAPGVLPNGEALDMKQEMKESVLEAMRFYAASMTIVDDLTVTVVRNLTGSPFITSDDPAILTNRWHLQNRRAEGLNFGLRNAGLVMILPLSPDRLALLHDGDVYSFAHRQGRVDLTRADDVAALNEIRS